MSWGLENKIMCDLIHRGISPKRIEPIILEEGNELHEPPRTEEEPIVQTRAEYSAV